VPLSYIPYIIELYIIVGCTILEYRRRERLTNGPYINVVIYCIIASIILLLLVIYMIYSF
jgi:hypothetical protein